MGGIPPIELHPTPNFTAGRGGERVRAIVLHTAVGTWDGTLEWFSRPESGVSAHYVVGLDGRLARVVAEEDTARHAGRVLRPTAAVAQGRDDLNPLSVGIEFCDDARPLEVRRPPAQYLTGARLLAAVASRWGIPIDREHVIGHNEVYAAKECPGNLDVERLVSEGRAFSG
jgi:N-acetylmuramoyl-L-alanine amidase